MPRDSQIEHAKSYLNIFTDPEGQEIGHRDLAEAKSEYAAALTTLKPTFPNMVCCDGFQTGACAHGKPCECGSQQAPWPWIVQGACGAFCDCHMDVRRAWMKPAGIRYW